MPIRSSGAHLVWARSSRGPLFARARELSVRWHWQLCRNYNRPPDVRHARLADDDDVLARWLPTICRLRASFLLGKTTHLRMKITTRENASCCKTPPRDCDLPTLSALNLFREKSQACSYMNLLCGMLDNSCMRARNILWEIYRNLKTSVAGIRMHDFKYPKTLPAFLSSLGWPAEIDWLH